MYYVCSGVVYWTVICYHPTLFPYVLPFCYSYYIRSLPAAMGWSSACSAWSGNIAPPLELRRGGGSGLPADSPWSGNVAPPLELRRGSHLPADSPWSRNVAPPLELRRGGLVSLQIHCGPETLHHHWNWGGVGDLVSLQIHYCPEMLHHHWSLGLVPPVPDPCCHSSLVLPSPLLGKKWQH